MIKIEKTIIKPGRYALTPAAGKAASTNNKSKKKETDLETQSKAYLLACHSGLQDVVLTHKPVKQCLQITD